MKKSLTHYKVEFLAYLTNQIKASPLTVKTYEVALRQMLEVCDVEEGDKKRLHLMPYRLIIAKQSKKTITKKLSAIRSFIHFINDYFDEHIELKDDATIKVSRSLPKPIEHDYIMQAVALADDEEKLVVLLLYGLGLRISELSHIRLADIKPHWIRVTGKGDKMRDVPLSSDLFERIKAYKAQNCPKKYLFEREAENLSEDRIRYIITKVFRRIGIKATPHQLRHSYATGLLENGARIEDVSELLGHESIATTQIYTQLGSSLKMKNYQLAHPLGHKDTKRG